MTLTVDASVAAKWFFEEEGSDRALSLRNEEVNAPDFILLEVHHAMWKRLIRREQDKAAVGRVQPALRSAIAQLIPSHTLADAAGRLSLNQNIAIYDCLYIALAETAGRTLITADQKQFSAARRLGIRAELL